MQLPSGCVGEIHGSEGLPSVQWRHPFNAWDLLACELATVCSQPYLMADSKVCVYLAVLAALASWALSDVMGPE